MFIYIYIQKGGRGDILGFVFISNRCEFAAISTTSNSSPLGSDPRKQREIGKLDPDNYTNNHEHENEQSDKGMSILLGWHQCSVLCLEIGSVVFQWGLLGLCRRLRFLEIVLLGLIVHQALEGRCCVGLAVEFGLGAV